MEDLKNAKFADVFRTRNGKLAVYVGKNFVRFGEIECTVLYVDGCGEMTYKKMTGECVTERNMTEYDIVEKV